ncbi:MAG: BtpA/SgcQ family protein [Patescibacteria group bacterium]|nr:BtpA/SgcQ family protein [Patescibacteria group bacterium]
MMPSFESLFGKDRDITIGAIHFPPLLGYPDFPGFDTALENALADLKAFEDGGADAVIIENNYDIPHKSPVDPEIVVSMAYLAGKMAGAAKVPIGVSVLWNDYRAALSLAKAYGLRFVRVPVFVDTVKTSYGIFEGNPKDVTDFRKRIGADDVLLLTDIHVKHSEMISPYTIEESARMAIGEGSDALIVTGRWTGDAPGSSDLKMARGSAGDFPILCGSGMDEANIAELYKAANGSIVSTSVKIGLKDSGETNMKPYSSRVDREKVKALVSKIESR